MVGAVVGLVWNLAPGSLFFYNADEVVERRDELGNERFTLQGLPIGCSIVEGFQDDLPIVAFSIMHGGVSADIVHFGDPAELFEPDVPVVLDGAGAVGSQCRRVRRPRRRRLVLRLRPHAGQARQRLHQRRRYEDRLAESAEQVVVAEACAEQRRARFGVVTIGAACAIAGIIVALLGILGYRPRWFADAKLLVGLMTLAPIAPVVIMERALITRDFTVQFVADNGSSQTPALFNIATLWRRSEGSVLLWVLVLCGYVVAVVVKFRNDGDDPMMQWVMLTLFVVCAFFFL